MDNARNICIILFRVLGCKADNEGIVHLLCLPNTHNQAKLDIMYMLQKKESGVSDLCLFAVKVLGKPVEWTEQKDTHTVGVIDIRE